MAEEVCDNDEVTIFDTWAVNTEEKDIKWNGLGFEILVTEDNYGNLRFRRQDVQTERIRITNYYYTKTGAAFQIPQQGTATSETGTWTNPIGGRVLDRTNPHGVCGDGDVTRDTSSVDQTTAAGTGQGNCPWQQ